jgi:hypothetical protein
MYNASRSLFRSGPFILGVEEWTDTRGAGIEGRMAGLWRPGVTSYSRSILYFGFFSFNDAMNNFIFHDWPYVRWW